MKTTNLLNTAILASVEAGKAILNIYEGVNLGIVEKEDRSPLTKADIEANKTINELLIKTKIPIISEENRQTDYLLRKEWDTCWMVDPLDGTKEFIKRNGEFTVNIALIEKGAPILGVIYVPVSRELYFADTKTKKAFKVELDNDHEFESELSSSAVEIKPKTISKSKVRVVGSRSHMNTDTEEFISKLKNNFEEVEIVSKGSSLKFCLVAEGKADIYPRFAPTMEWDTAAGHAICTAVGLTVVSKETNEELVYNKENLLNSFFILRSDGKGIV